jgi:DNA helicase-2/ATP-dependent DNA helicase PcrA
VPEWLKNHSDLIGDCNKAELTKYLVQKTNRALSSNYYIEWLKKGAPRVPLASLDEVLAYWKREIDSRKAYDSYSRYVKAANPDLNKIKAAYAKVESTRIIPDEDRVSPPGTWVRDIVRLKNGYVTFDDIIKMAIFILKNNPESLEYWQNQFDYVQCDEFQDTDFNQLELVKLIYERTGNLFVVGDPDQSIYLFRGANPTVLTNLGEYIPNLKTIFMNNNYRSTPEIVGASDDVITLNKNRIKKTCRSMSGSDGENSKVVVIGGDDSSNKEITYIEDLLKNGIRPEQIAVLYTNRRDEATQVLQTQLASKGIPFTTTLVEDMTWYNATLELLKYNFKSQKRFLYNFAEKLNIIDNGLDIDTLKGIEEDTNSIFSLFDSLKESYRKTDGKPTADYQRFLNSTKLVVSQIENAINYWVNLTNEQKENECIENPDDLLRGISPKDGEGIVITTIHASKGLEWDYVFVNGLEPNTFFLKMDSGSVLEEKARLAYVAYSRARKKLYVHSFDSNSPFIAKIADKSFTEFINPDFKKDFIDKKEIACGDYFKSIDTKTGFEYNKLVADDIVVGWRSTKYIDGRKYYYQAKIEDLERLNCVPKSVSLLVKVGRDIPVVKQGENFVSNDLKDDLADGITITKDEDIIKVFQQSSSPFTYIAPTKETLKEVVGTKIVVSEETPEHQRITLCSVNDSLALPNELAIKITGLNSEYALSVENKTYVLVGNARNSTKLSKSELSSLNDKYMSHAKGVIQESDLPKETSFTPSDYMNLAGRTKRVLDIYMSVTLDGCRLGLKWINNTLVLVKCK